MPAWLAQRGNLKAWLPAALALALAVFVGVSVWQARQARQMHDLAADFSVESRELAMRLQERMTAYRQILRGTRSLWTVQGVLSREEWWRHVAHLMLQTDFPGVRGLGFMPFVAREHQERHVGRMQRNGYPDYQLKAASSEGSLAPVARLAPETSANLELLGTDLASMPALRDAMRISAERGVTRLSAPVMLRHGPGERQHVLMLQAVFEPGSAPDRGAPFGWVFALFDTTDLIAATLGTLPPNLRLRVQAGRDGADATTIFDSHPAGLALRSDREPLKTTAPLSIDGQDWLLVFEGFPRAYTHLSPLSGELLAILVICGLFGLSVVLATQSRLGALRLRRLSAELEASNQRYLFLATHDALTRVANRALFHERLSAALSRSGRHARCFGLIYIDLDHFKQANDRFGHEVGDLLLVEATQRMQTLLRDTDLLARRGGDEFVVLLDELAESADAGAVAARICAELARPFTLQGHEVRISGSLGVAVYPRDGGDAEALIAVADRRMYAVKKAGRNAWAASDV
ncbi:MAG: sensor domain-containing diguanylate cyclase [Betaproteobacteria bacterium]|nr:sensor domain-containing diguanylate cyclase [Betaproteobacteria bacterium]